MSITRNATCPCCGLGSETIMHTIFECPKLDDIREVFLQKLETILPETRNVTNADRLALLLGDDPPQKIENLLYRFLTSLFTLPPVFLADWCRFGVADVTKSNFPSFPKILLHMRGFSALAHD